MLNVVVGHSCDPDSQSAIAEVLEQCLDALAGTVPKAGILFAAIHFDHAPILQQIQQCFAGIELIGGTTDGELSSVLGFQEDSLTLMLFSSDTIEIRAGVGRGVSQDPVAAAQQAIAQATTDLTEPPKLCIALSESLTTRAEGVLQGLKQALGLQVPIVGGLTADQYRFQQTFQFFQTEVLSNAAPVLLFAGDLLVSCGVSSGSCAVGKKGRVTKVDKNTVYEIDGQSAYDFYRHYLGNLLVDLDIGLAVFEPNQQHFSLRLPSKESDLASGKLVFYGDIPEGAIVQIAQTNRNDILTAAKLSSQQALAAYPGNTPAAALLFSCTVRRRLLGPKTDREYAIIRDLLAMPIPSCGFYTYGEISPFEIPGESQFHNQTFVTLLLGTK
ncbi:FIST N-terminal domain-containing protein [Oscillatoria sp. FACHB-1406]|uniref:FIST signal transduction protein n=1 Tax=Oscillatoria sp. FACHB-1406 TaxID=2692846 RepID=UPI0016883A8F|nr:FIST N-terminal domain-containing protein [Oscillatoria sp. FACHB-1406]MBD2579577.1 FIST C-terminal domain-containing protein [Oscillatoria sp. FACHB-1406]